MASVREVYTTLQGLANKDERGFVTPAVFNQFAAVAQQKVYNDMWIEFERAQAQRLRGLDPGMAESRLRALKQDLAKFVVRPVPLGPNTDDADYPRKYHQYDLPDNFNRVVEVNYFPPGAEFTADDPAGTATEDHEVIPIEVIEDHSKLQAVLSSRLARPSLSNPICYITFNRIEVYPYGLAKNWDTTGSADEADETRIDFVYYKNPEGINAVSGSRTVATPKFSYTVVNNKEVYSASGSVDFELPEHYVMDLVIEMAKLIGVNLKDREVFQHGSQEDVKELRK